LKGKPNRSSTNGEGDGGEPRGWELDQLCRFASMLGTTLDTETIISDSTESLMAMVAADRAVFALAGEDQRVLIPIATVGWETPALAKGIPAPVVASLGTEALAYSDGGELPAQLQARLGEIPDPVAVIPLWAHARLRGVAILRRRKNPFSPSSLKLLTAAGRQLALAVENSQLLADLQQSYRKLMDAQEELIRSERLAALGQLSATLAHEIRNPLATIFSAISQIRKHSKGDGIAVTMLDIAEEEATRLNRMVAGLLEFARPRKPSFESLDLLALLRDTVRGFLQAGPIPEGVSVELDPASVPVELEVDPDLLQKAVVSLLANAVNAVEGSGGAVRVLLALAGKSGAALVEIRDDGVGISQENLSRVCEPFFSTRPSGTGLGLPTAKRIVEDHAGTIEIESEPGRGTVVRLLIPPGAGGGPPKEVSR
jgi:signal transduction histidine kinase